MWLTVSISPDVEVQGPDLNLRSFLYSASSQANAVNYRWVGKSDLTITMMGNGWSPIAMLDWNSQSRGGSMIYCWGEKNILLTEIKKGWKSVFDFASHEEDMSSAVSSQCEGTTQTWRHIITKVTCGDRNTVFISYIEVPGRARTFPRTTPNTGAGSRLALGSGASASCCVRVVYVLCTCSRC